MEGTGEKPGIGGLYLTAIAQIFMENPNVRPGIVRGMFIEQLDLDEDDLPAHMLSEKQVLTKVSYYKSKIFKLVGKMARFLRSVKIF